MELASISSPQDALSRLLRVAVDATEADLGAFLVVGADASWRVDCSLDRRGTPAPEIDSLIDRRAVADAIDQGRVVCPTAWQRRRVADGDARPRTLVCVPIAVGGRVHGALYLARRAQRRTLTGAQIHALSLLGGMSVPFMVANAMDGSRPEGALERLLGDSPKMRDVKHLVEKVARSDLSVLVLGETGTGKELTARAIHLLGRRRDRPIVAFNCCAVPESLLESELFGARKGAYTGATENRVGRIEAADGSTLVLDEIGDMPLTMQAALLRVLEERSVVRIGDTQPRPVDFRLIAATNKNLEAEVAAGRFRSDLLFRLREVSITLPPLRERNDDVLLLARLFLHQIERELGLPVHTISPRAEKAILAYRWPGNVRELRAVMRRAAVLCERLVVTADDLELPVAMTGADPPDDAPCLGSLDRPLHEARDDYVRRYVGAVLERHDGDRGAAASALGVSLRSLYRYMPR